MIFLKEIILTSFLLNTKFFIKETILFKLTYLRIYVVRTNITFQT